MNGVIEMLESGYRLNSLRLDALAGDESGSIVVVDAPLSVGSRERDSETPTGRALDIPARGALAVLTPLVDELSVLLQSGAANNSETPTLSSQWISWCAQIEDASARATLTLLEARLWAEASTAGKPPVAAQAHPVYDEAASTEVDAARGGSNPDEPPG